MTVRVSAIVVNLSQEVLLRACLASLEEALRPLEGNHEIIVVDNGSADSSVEMIRAEFPDVHLIELGENTGFAGGVSVGIRNATGDWVLCVNNDATVAPDAVEELLRVAALGDDRVGSVAAQMVFADRPDMINSAGIELDRLGVASDRLLGEPVEASETDPVEVFGTSAGAGLYRMKMLEDVPFEETFFAYLEDVDVAWRARVRGWKCLYAPAAVVRHHHSATAIHASPLKYYWSGRNRVRLLARNATGRQLVRNSLAIFVYEVMYVTYALARDHTVAPIRGRLDGMRHWRSDRTATSSARRDIELAPFLGFRAAVRRARGGRKTA